MVPTLLGQDPSAPGNFLVDDGSRVVSMTPAEVIKAVPAGEVNRFVQGPGNSIGLFQNSIPNPNSFDALTIPYMQATDIIYHKFYDSVALTSAAANTGRFFLTPQSAIYNGNLTGNGVLSSNERFFMVGIRFTLENNDTTNPLDFVDCYQTWRLGTHSFQLAQKSYNQGKLLDFINPNPFIVLNTKYYSGDPFVTTKLPLPIAIGRNMQFFDEFNLTAATLDNTTRQFCIINGYWYRNVQ